MSEPTGDLQFERAQFDAPAATSCAGCHQVLYSSYWEVNGQLACEACRMKAEWDWKQGSGVGRFARAFLFGGIAAAIGAVVYYGIVRLTGYELSLISIAVGIMVGVAVRKGSAGRGGLPYQCLAMFLTYTSIVSSYAPFLLQGLAEHKAAPAKSAQTTSGSKPDPAASLAIENEKTPQNDEKAEKLSGVRLVIGVVVISGLIYASPFLALFSGGQGFMGIVIIGIGVWQAFKINRKAGLLVAGPFSIGKPKSPTPDAA